MKKEVEPLETCQQMKERARSFQAGKNPMEMSSFEKELVEEEKESRWQATKKYIHGIQGIDGGVCTGRDACEKYWGGTNAAR